MIGKPAVASHTISFDSDNTGNTVLAVSHPCEVVAVLASAGAGAVAVSIYDGTATPGNKRVFIAANAGESTSFTPNQNMKFLDSVRVVFEQGGQGQGGGEVSLVLNI